ncbi:hypothetical protein BDV98DRAFT_416499 [Pterulicium gracile]|uniref:Uncharacterized protein n=1 Tax=Pterulicium gracile TaxID=1884261 RepID=A0A5C3QP29_9AGAR|nr:hypothetical protein BDV98DRAFT_416499 [Pterula gracilis]
MGPPRAQAPHSFQRVAPSASASPSSVPGSSLVDSRPPAPTAPRPTKRESPLNNTSRPPKKARKQENQTASTNTNTSAAPPALLARLSTSSVPSENGVGSPRRSQQNSQMSMSHPQNRAQGHNRAQGQPSSNTNTPRNLPAPSPSAPPFLSIKGAADRASSSSRPESPALPSRPSMEQRSLSLLDRVSGSPVGAGSGRGKKRR